MKALRELLIRTDSMDTRLGNYGENLRKINTTIYGKQHQSKQTHQSTFLQELDHLTFDDTMEDPINRSRSCDETSFFEVLDEINCSIAQPTEKFVIGSNKRVRILPGNPSTSSETQTTSTQKSNSTIVAVNNPASLVNNDSKDEGNESRSNSTVERTGSRTEPNDSTRPNIASLRVAKKDQTDNDMVSFYVTPFTPEQNENDLKQHVHEIANVDSSQLKITKLVPRGKSLEDLSFVSFKVTVSKTVSEVVGDPWYWPEGITVRMFEPNQKNEPSTRHLKSS